jgi:hypothetical protein
MWIQVVIIIRNQAIKMISISSNEGHGALEKENASYQWCLIGFFNFPWNLEHCGCIAFTYSGVSLVANQVIFTLFFVFLWVAETDRFQKEIRCCSKAPK